MIICLCPTTLVVDIMKSHDLPSDEEILRAFNSTNFGVEDPKLLKKILCTKLIQLVSGYAVGFTIGLVLVKLKLAKYQKNSFHINVTAYGYRCINSAHEWLAADRNKKL